MMNYLAMKILLDLVPGHTSDTHEWFIKSKEPLPNEYSNRYIWTKSAWDAPPQYRMLVGITDRDGNYMVNYFSSQPALNYGFHEITHPEWQLPCDHPDCLATVEALKDIMRFWLDKGCDGFRVDMADSLVKNDDEKVATARIWKDIRKMMDKDYPEAALVSEWCHPVRSLYKAGFHMDFYLDHRGNGYSTLFRYLVDGEDKSFFSKNGKGDVTVFTDEYVPNLKATKDCGYISMFTSNHDIPRMTNNLDETARKLAFWTDGKNLGFSTADENKLYLPVDKCKNAPTVENQQNKADSIYNVVKDIIRIRRENNADLGADGDFEVIYAERNKYPFVYKRGNFIIGVNPSGESQSIDFDYDSKEITYQIGDFKFENCKLTLSAQSFVLMKI